MSLPASSNLMKTKEYLNRYDIAERPGAFEFLVAAAFAQSLHLPFQYRDTEDSTVEHRVLWYGQYDKRNRTFSYSPAGADSICFAYGYYILIEATTRGNVGNQWRREFVECMTHYDNFISERNLEKRAVYLALVAPEFHRNTYTGFKQKAIEGNYILLLESATLARISKICKNIPTLRHLDLRQLLRDMVGELRNSGSLKGLRKGLSKCINDWEVNLLRQEKTVYFGLKGYEAMKRVGRNTVGISEIMIEFQRDGKLEYCMRKLGGGDLADYVKKGLLTEKLARCVPGPDEDLFRKVDGADFRARSLRVIRAVEAVERSH